MPRTISVPLVTRIEGDAALDVRMRADGSAGVTLRISEPPRLFEGLLVGRRAEEAVDITARICGICPVAHQVTAMQAIEQALGVEVGPAVRALRRLLYCGEWIESHALHVYLLHAPDFLGYDGALEMARDHAPIVKRGLEIKKAGNLVVTVVGGREVHPVNPRVGGFYRAPAPAEVAALAEPLRRALDASLETVSWVAGFDFPDLETDAELVALRYPGEYPIGDGRIVSSGGLDFPADRFEDEVAEEQVLHSHALRASLRGRGPYLVGPLARYALNADRLSALTREAAGRAGLASPCRNPFRSIVVRSLEMLYACEEALRLVESYEPPDPPAPIRPRAGTGRAVTEAPRGLLYHRYDLDGAGLIRRARIVPPTAQNQESIEADLARLVPRHLDLPRAELARLCERAVRNHDPCISCATHFLRLDVS